MEISNKFIVFRTSEIGSIDCTRLWRETHCCRFPLSRRQPFWVRCVEHVVFYQTQFHELSILCIRNPHHSKSIKFWIQRERTGSRRACVDYDSLLNTNQWTSDVSFRHLKSNESNQNEMFGGVMQQFTLVKLLPPIVSSTTTTTIIMNRTIVLCGMCRRAVVRVWCACCILRRLVPSMHTRRTPHIRTQREMKTVY